MRNLHQYLIDGWLVVTWVMLCGWLGFIITYDVESVPAKQCKRTMLQVLNTDQCSKFREVLFIFPICVYGPILLAGGVNMRLRCIKKKIVRHERILGNLTTYVRKTHLPTFTMNAGNHRKKIVHVARSIFCVICVFNVFWVAGTLISLFSVK